ncbi:MAG: ATP-binding cassette domain-containing protein [Candidatus Bipolaricaulota bacterium]|nr:ATP-binding cassette domain-containing protein [Candidatus Bipolaricaulota bacterium]MCS7273969.1 ATP-binding cassette domain-containing protein [Candidatus Bipolaricaulota bacterium]MDW8329821.1 ATP-binding cassette domain-containing protein [Candidatus Bipolaricaulota bacterium]
MIEVKDLRKSFGKFVAVDGLSFSVKPGEIFGLLGPNGAGKTTTLRMISTVLKPDAGLITVNGYDARREPERVRAQLGVVAESNGLYDRLTALENMRYFARLYGLSEEKITERVRELAPRLGLDEFMHKRAGQFSRGMKQKVSIAIALLHDPPVLIFDEPTVGLDVMTARQVRQFIKECRRPDKCVIFSTHIMSEVERLCDRIGIIHKGRLVALGTLSELRQRSGQHDLEEIFVELVEGEDRAL